MSDKIFVPIEMRNVSIKAMQQGIGDYRRIAYRNGIAMAAHIKTHSGKFKGIEDLDCAACREIKEKEQG